MTISRPAKGATNLAQCTGATSGRSARWRPFILEATAKEDEPANDSGSSADPCSNFDSDI
jgi:hypothetical protein